jgi:hypothetical protein
VTFPPARVLNGDDSLRGGAARYSVTVLSRACFLRLLFVFLLAVPAKADAGVPMLFITWPGMLLALIPVVFIEAWIMRPRLELTSGKALKLAAIANLVSTVVGIPLTWMVLAGLEMLSTGGGMAYGLSTPWQRILSVTVQAPWLVPYESDLYWMVPAATLALLPAYFLASWGIEYAVIRMLLRIPVSSIFETERTLSPGRPVRRAVLFANLGSYTILAVLTLLWLGIAIMRGPQHG